MVSIVKRNRKLENEEDVFNYNAWDDTEWTSEMLEEAERKVEKQRTESRDFGIKIDDVEPKVTQRWNQFYEAHGDKFFKDRQWIFSEFPEVSKCLNSDSEPCKIFEVGCGVGNTIAHIIGSNCNPNLHIYGCDLSHTAIDTLKKRELFQSESGKITTFQADVCKDFNDVVCKRIDRGSIDLITMIFTLSAFKPETMEATIKNLVLLLKPNGMILFRDYAQYDLTQLRFKGKSYLRDNYYVRSDGTTSYFFTNKYVDELFSGAGLSKIELKNDNRLLVNRLKSLKMCRCWIQAKYKKVC